MLKISKFALFSVMLLAVNVSTATTTKDNDKLPVSASQPAQTTPTVVSPKTTFPVVIDGIEIIKISTSPIASLTPENRANLIQQNIQTFANSKSDTHALKISTLAEGLSIGIDGGGALMVITNLDAESSGKSSSALANEVLQAIQTAVANYRNKYALKTYGIAAAFTLLAILGLWLTLRLNNRAFKWLVIKVLKIENNWMKGISVKGIEVLSAGRIKKVVMLALKTQRIFVALLCLYFFLPLILSFFPETRKLSGKIFDYFITPFESIFYKLIDFIPNMFYIFVIVVIAFYVLKMISYVFSLIERGELKFDWFYDDWARPTYQIVRFLVIVTALISAYPYIPGSSSQAFQGVGLVLGAILSFASSSAISNIVAGIILTYTRAFRLNDRIKLGETTGDVVEKTLLVTRIKTIKHVIVTIPNSLVMGAQIINYSTSAADGDGVILHTSVTIGYDVPWQKVEQLLIAAALATDKILPQPQPFVLHTSLDDYYVSHEINAYTKEPKNMATIYSALHKNILDKFDADGVEIMSPHYFSLRDGNSSTVPSVLKGGGYTAPAFKIDGVE